MRRINDQNRENVKAFIREYWGSEKMVSKGNVHYPGDQEGFLVKNEQKIVGLITYEIRGDELEITLLDSRERNKGIGTQLVNQVKETGKEQACKRIWLITTNDNIRAIQFYQKCSFDLVKLHYGSMKAARKLKPGIPKLGYAGIPISHELEFEYILHKRKNITFE